MADTAKVPGKAASAVKDSVKDAAEAVEETTEKAIPTFGKRFAAFRSNQDVEEYTESMKPILPPLLFAGLALVNPAAAASAATYTAVKRYQNRNKQTPTEDTTANA